MSCKLSNSKSSDEINNNKSSLELSFSLGKLRKLCLTFPMPNLLIEGDMGMRGVLQLSSKKKIVCIVCRSSRKYVCHSASRVDHFLSKPVRITNLEQFWIAEVILHWNHFNHFFLNHCLEVANSIWNYWKISIIPKENNVFQVYMDNANFPMISNGFRDF